MNIFKKKLKIGQVWAIKSSNPFRRGDLNAEILDIKDGYILSQPHWIDHCLDLPDPSEKSDKISTFRIIYKDLVKDV